MVRGLSAPRGVGRTAWPLVLVLGAGWLALADEPAPTPLPRRAAPTLTAEAVGPTTIRLTVATSPEVTTVVAERTSDGHAPERQVVVVMGRSPASQVVRALPSTTYSYRAKVEIGGTSEWSAPVSVRTPAAPTVPPAPPTDLTARARSPFAVDLDWRAGGGAEYGFALERREGAEWVRVVLLDPGTTRYAHHGRAPDSDLVYRVRAFNAAGVSSASNEASVRTERISDTPAVLADAWTRSEAGREIAPCTTREQTRRAQRDDEGRPPLEGTIAYGKGHALYLLAAADSCGNANCNWIAYGTYDGCYRELGFLGGTGTEVVTTTPSGLPVLVGAGHDSASMYGAHVTQIVGGRLLDVDAWTACSVEGEDDLAKASPPFEDCQRDGDLWTVTLAKKR